VPKTQRQYLIAGACIVWFIAVQAFQEVAYRFWIPASHGPFDDLSIYLLRIDKIRALLLMASILTLILPYSVIALRYFKTRPLASICGFFFSAAFIGLEMITRSVDFFVVGQSWARQFSTAANGAEREIILQHLGTWNEVAYALYFPLMLSYLLASLAFLTSTVGETGNLRWLVQAAFALNALRLLGRMLSTFAGQAWLAPLNDTAYFPTVLLVNLLLASWFFRLARGPVDDSGGGQQLA